MKAVKLFVEGGGDSRELRTKCRTAFNSFLVKSGMSGYMPRIIASGSRRAAYEDYCTAISSGEEAVLLVDSETAVITPAISQDCDVNNPKTWKPWHHLKNRIGTDGVVADNWDKPESAADEDCHLMVQSMETWLLADISALKGYYERDFNENRLPKRQDIEAIGKTEGF